MYLWCLWALSDTLCSQAAAEHGDSSEAGGGVAVAGALLLPAPARLYAGRGRVPAVAALPQRRHQTWVTRCLRSGCAACGWHTTGCQCDGLFVIVCHRFRYGPVPCHSSTGRYVPVPCHSSTGPVAPLIERWTLTWWEHTSRLRKPEVRGATGVRCSWGSWRLVAVGGRP